MEMYFLHQKCIVTTSYESLIVKYFVFSIQWLCKWIMYKKIPSAYFLIYIYEKIYVQMMFLVKRGAEWGEGRDQLHSTEGNFWSFSWNNGRRVQKIRVDLTTRVPDKKFWPHITRLIPSVTQLQSNTRLSTELILETNLSTRPWSATTLSYKWDQLYLT